MSNFIAAKCPACNADIQVPDDNDFVICEYCKTNVKVRDALKIIIDAKTSNLLKIANEAYNTKNFIEAYNYYNKILESEIDNYEAWIGKALCCGYLSDLNTFRFDEMFNYFQKAIDLCSEENKQKTNIYLANELVKMIQEVHNNIRVYFFENNISDNVIKLYDKRISEIIDAMKKTVSFNNKKEYYNIFINILNKNSSGLTRKLVTQIGAISRVSNVPITLSCTNKIRETVKLFRAKILILDVKDFTISDYEKMANDDKYKFYNIAYTLKNYDPKKYKQIEALYNTKKALDNKRLKRNVIIFVSAAFILFLIIYISALNLDNSYTRKNVEDSTTQQKMLLTKLIDGGNYDSALSILNSKEEDDTVYYYPKGGVGAVGNKYSKVSYMIELVNEKIKENERKEQYDKVRDKEREKERIAKQKNSTALEKKYKKMFEGNGWLHEKQSKLARMGFDEYKSGYEKAPDGSNQIKTYYKKYENSCYIHVALQYSYSIEHHYSWVWVE